MGSPRRAAPRDLDAVAKLWEELLEHHARLEPHYRTRPGAGATLRSQLDGLLASGAAALFVQEADGELLGFASARVVEAPPLLREPRRGELLELVVRSDARRRGLGRELVEAASAWLRSRDVERVEVRVAVANAAAQAFWRRLGYADFVDVLHRRL